MLFGTIGVIGGSFLSPAQALTLNIGDPDPTAFTNFDTQEVTLEPGKVYTSWNVKNMTGYNWTHFTFTNDKSFTFTSNNPKYINGIPTTRFYIPGHSTISFPGKLSKFYGLQNGGQLNLFDLFSPGGGKITVAQDTIFTGTPSVPGPLPILGIVSAFGFSRKLRKRIKLSNEASVAVVGNN